jgi:photosystem II stability/assembly factor-like uncharacterized protein
MRRLLALALLALACSTTRKLPEPAGFERDDLGERRERWLFEQRAYPFDSIPADARRKALAQVDAHAHLSDVEAEATFAPYWRSLGPQPVHTEWSWDAATGRVVSLAVAPNNPSLILAGASTGGIWRSTDAGAHFTPVSDTQADLAVGEIVFAPSNPNIVYAAMGNDFLGSGVLRSDDAGAHWQLVSGPSYATRGSAPSLVVDRNDSNRLWVAQYSHLDESSGIIFASGILRSTNGGGTWKSQFDGLTSDLAALPNNSDTLLAGVIRNDEQSGNSGIYRSTNGGTSWSLVVDAGADTYSYPRIAVTPASPQRVYAHIYSNGPSGASARFVTSDNGGMTWRDVAAAGLPDEYSIFVAVDPTNAAFVYVGMRDLYRSSDGGQTFSNMTRGYTDDGNFDPVHSTSHVDQHSLAFAPSALYLGNDGGIFRSDDAALTFTSLSGALSLVQAYGIAAHPLDPSAIFLGTQDNGMERRDPDGHWHELITGDYGSIVFDANDPEVLATNYVEGLILGFTDRGSSYLDTLATNSTFSESESGGRISFIAPFESLRSAATLYFGTWRLFTSHDFGRTWSAPGGAIDLTKGNPDTLGAIGVSASNPDVIYTGSMKGQVMTTRNGGTSWTPAMAGLPDRAVRAITVDPANADVAYIGFSGYAANHVWKTTNGGISWQALGEALPDVPVNALLLDDGALYAGTDIGVFRFESDRWTYFSNGLPPVIVTDFAVTASGTIVAATHGRGAYELVERAGRRRGVRH